MSNLIEEAKTILERNVKTGMASIGGIKKAYFYICPAAGKYPHQWLWDSCFHAIVNCRLNPQWAKQELKTLLSVVDDEGFLPSMIRWQGGKWPEILAWPLFKGNLSRITQPPVVATAVEEVFKTTQDLEYLKEVLPALERYYLWLGTQRDPDKDNLVSIIHPWESADDSPAFDRALLGKDEGRPNPAAVYISFYKLLIKYGLMGWMTQKIFSSNLFNVENVMFNCIYAQGLRSLGRLSAVVSEMEKARTFDKKADLVEEAILRLCYDPEKSLFFDVIHKGDSYERNDVMTISSIFPIILDTIPKEVVTKIVENHLANRFQFWLPYPIPFVSKEEASFNPEDNVLLWRGPVWINTNWFIWKGLLKHGYIELADELAKKTIALVEKSGFREFYNPFTGRGEGQKNYSWSTLVVEMLNT
ncbi:MAG: Trehalase-like protein [Microgenomates group bacterium GW2011_GWA1_Microgenomates_45_10]|nr:MAG: Trehalase-like protein [Microgenomates group bacterium GW2011_GWA2_44_7]KKT77342.1 MAG: Trehalase-like protein [Microgenomates group bacterium GW2011_GWB1_44_8]KKT87107.1 MAG: Trehalase-like protein [Microgenomates group bacterium GW2011_GWA1_Microgenomates_45_10]